jgi:transketolase
MSCALKKTYETTSDYQELARRIRVHCVQMNHDAPSSHLGSCLSCADILAVLYGGVLNIRPQEPKWEDRDRFILSKGHAAAALYSVLAERGFFSVEELETFNISGNLMGHANHEVPGVDVSTGSLGHGLSIGCGMALAAKRDKKNYRVYTLLSDGDLNEGSTWEAVMFAGQHQLDNLTTIIDCNGLQAMGKTDDIIQLEPLWQKLVDFAWSPYKLDGHDYRSLEQVLLHPNVGFPSCVVAHTVKGKGVSFCENHVSWHYKRCNDKELTMALGELKCDQHL